jgi:hypothetical protein
VARRAIDDVLAGGPGPRGVVVTAPAGAGKSYLVDSAAVRAGALGLRVAVASPTNDQAFGLVGGIARMLAGGVVAFMPANGVSLPADVAALPGVTEVPADHADGEQLVVATLSKFGDAFTRGKLQLFDLLLLDESYQADSGRYFAAAGLASVHLLVGDGGQISPFSTIAEPGRWRGLPEDPLQTAVDVLLRNHPSTPVHGLPITRRLDSRGVAVARRFYPGLNFDPAVLPGVRELKLRTAGRPRGALGRALDMAARHGWGRLELPQAPVLPADPETVELLANLVARLFERGARAQCDRQRRPVALRPEQVAVGVSHNDQKDLLRVALHSRRLGGVVVETVNKLQGLEFEVVFVWHPLAGLPEADGFHLDPGRLCVLLTRHRQACIVVGRHGDRDLLEERLPPPTEAYLGWDPEPVLDGWEIHREVFNAWEPFTVHA